MESPLGARLRTGDFAALAIVLIATTALAGLMVVSPPSAPAPLEGDAAAAVTTATPAASASASDSPRESAEPASCAAAFVEAPNAGSWLLYRAEYGTRGRTAYLRLKLRRDGQSDSVAGARAEVMPSADVPARTGLAMPAQAEHALVVQFDGPVGSRGQFGGGGAGALGRFVVGPGTGGSVYVVAALREGRCLRLDGGAWQAGDVANAVDILVELAGAPGFEPGTP